MNLSERTIKAYNDYMRQYRREMAVRAHLMKSTPCSAGRCFLWEVREMAWLHTRSLWLKWLRLDIRRSEQDTAAADPCGLDLWCNQCDDHSGCTNIAMQAHDRAMLRSEMMDDSDGWDRSPITEDNAVCPGDLGTSCSVCIHAEHCSSTTFPGFLVAGDDIPY